jgi:integrase
MILTKHAALVLSDQESMLKSYGIISPWTFPDMDGSAMDTRNSYEEWKKYRAQHGIASSLYELRHTMISLTKSDMPKPLLQLIVGHSESMDTLGIYGHEVTGELDRAATILDDVFDNLLKKSTH